MAPIRWAASAPLLPPLRHLTRSIVRRNGECVSEFTQQQQQQQQDPPLSGADDRRRLGFIEARLRASDTIGHPHVVEQRDLRKSISETQSLTPANSYQLALRVKRGTVLSAPKKTLDIERRSVTSPTPTPQRPPPLPRALCYTQFKGFLI